jgi:hypothetical protein
MLTRDAVQYVQGMNAICGALLYVMPELDAFNCIAKLVEGMYLYFQPDIRGVHAGLRVRALCIRVLMKEKVMEKILEYSDPELYAHLRANKFTPQLLTNRMLCCTVWITNMQRS